MNYHLLLTSIDNRLWLANCKIDGRKLLVGFGYFGYFAPGEQQEVVVTGYANSKFKVRVPDNAMDCYGSVQSNFYLELISIS